MGVNLNSLVPRVVPPPLGALDQWSLDRMAQALQGSPLLLQLWDGRRVHASTAPPVATIVIRDRKALVRMLLRPGTGFGEMYAAGRVQVHGDLVRMVEGVNRAPGARSLDRYARRARANTQDAARHNVHAHYDLGNDFYRLWLDDRMVYTCAYFERPDASLEEAQRAKLDYVCRKLRLRPGERVVEAGCGWGALALHMARHYGVTVQAFNISPEQLAFARARASAEGLSERVTFVDGDYRAIEGSCDAFVSVGMLEHVGKPHYMALGEVIDRVIDPAHGRALLHFIGRNTPREFNEWITRYIFPGAYAPALAEVAEGVCHGRSLSIVDVENLRRHYAATLRHWLERFECHAERIAEMFDESFVRTWRLYLASAQAGFLSGDLQLFQMTIERPHDDRGPWTRRGLYGDA